MLTRAQIIFDCAQELKRHRVVFESQIPTRKTFPCNHPLKPHFYIVKLGLCRGIPVFLIFDLKHRLWVLVQNFNFLKLEKNLRILHGHVANLNERKVFYKRVPMVL